ncbi:hypothetical protein OH491_06025 [Termitidicoccus mucosus]|uniref:Phytase-like domain-containing protein n=1 Tax=Termitidicoccus mucosus TaxID=1184151 RepID=A0A178IGW5_9BACT|nr:hypothetical protein AW736_18955 [Opitutaceae bacterium TSB47]
MKAKPARALAFCCILACLCAALPAQPVETQTAVREYNFPGKYEGKSAQGLAIFQEIALLFNDEGHCRVYNLETKKKLVEFDLASAAGDNHANSASFGVEQTKGAFFPAVYVSECRGQRRCFVESITPDGPRLVQTLQIKTGGTEERSFDWVVDRENKFIYSLAGFKKDAQQHVQVTKWPLPSLAQGKKITFKKSDILAQFSVSFPNLTQGACVRGGYLYMPVGLHDVEEGTPEFRSRQIIVINLQTQKIEKKIDINASCPHEPEDCDFHGDTMLLYCGQRGGLWRIPGV